MVFCYGSLSRLRCDFRKMTGICTKRWNASNLSHIIPKQGPQPQPARWALDNCQHTIYSFLPLVCILLCAVSFTLDLPFLAQSLISKKS